MTTQLAVRLPDEMVHTMEIAIKRGWAPNRSQLIKAALERDLRRMAAEHDRARLAEVGAADDLDELVSWSAAHFKMED